MHKTLAALALFAAGAAQAEIHRPASRMDAIPDSPRWVLNGAVVSGGERLALEVDVQSGRERDRIRAGSLYQLAAGALFPVAEDWAIQATAGIVRDSIHSNVNDTKGSFHKKFVEAIPYWGFGRHRLGLGVTYYYSAKFSWNGDESAGDRNLSIDFKPEAAPTLAYDWFYDESLAFGLRTTRASFSIDKLSAAGVTLDDVDGEIDADNTGIQVSLFF